MDDVQVDFGDLTLMVGPQGTGKSLVLQLLKFALDSTVVKRTIGARGGTWDQSDDFGLLATYLGDGYESSLSSKPTITFDGKGIRTLRSNARDARVFFIPAQRVVTFARGWPKSFMEYDPGDPFVVREFSQELFELFARGLGRNESSIFPQKDRLKVGIRRAIEESIFHGGVLSLKHDGARKQLVIKYKNLAKKTEVSLPFLEWSAGQREFSPLLLGMYPLLPAGKVSKHSSYRWVVIEEPEMGLHPDAIHAVMLLTFDLLARGYKIAMSTHSPYVLEMVWALQRLKESNSPNKLKHVCSALKLDQSLKSLASKLLEKEYRVHSMRFNAQGEHYCTDISSLDLSSKDKDAAGWGGLSSTSDGIADAVARGSR